MMDREHKRARYTTLMASGIQGHGIGLELHWSDPGQDSVVAEILCSDADQIGTQNTFDCDVRLELIEELIAKAKHRRAPSAQ